MDPREDRPARARLVIDTILTRRSVREGFSGRPLDEETLAEIVRCGLAAPSSKNAQPWRLHVVSDRGILRSLADLVTASPGADSYVPHDPTTGKPRARWASTVSESAEVLRGVATGIFVENRGAFSGGRQALADAARESLIGSLVGYTLEVAGIGAAIQNMWIAAHAQGVQAAFMGDVAIAEAAIRERLGIQGDLVGVLALGYSNVSPPATHPPEIDDPDKVVWHG
jgi:nitroreductase